MNKLEVKERVINKLKKEIEMLSNMSETEIEKEHGLVRLGNWSVGGLEDKRPQLVRINESKENDIFQCIHFGYLDEESEGNDL